MAKIVVVADDTDEVRVFLSEMLKRAGFTVFQAKDWLEVREAMRHEPDLYIMDNLGPEGTHEGFDLAKNLHKIGQRVIWTSILPSPEGVRRFMKEPGKMNELVQIVRNTLGG